MKQSWNYVITRRKNYGNFILPHWWTCLVPLSDFKSGDDNFDETSPKICELISTDNTKYTMNEITHGLWIKAGRRERRYEWMRDKKRGSMEGRESASTGLNCEKGCSAFLFPSFHILKRTPLNSSFFISCSCPRPDGQEIQRTSVTEWLKTFMTELVPSRIK